jgi:hypothetical protein
MGYTAKYTLPLLAAILVIVGLATAGCSGSGPRAVAGSGTGSGSSGLETALARFPDTPGMSNEIYYDNTAELTSLADEGHAAEGNGYGQLRGMGSGSFMVMYLAQLPGETGVNLLNESYAVSAGRSPAQLTTLVAGGQNAPLVTTRMARLGWKKGSDGVMSGPPLPLTVVHIGTSEYVIPFQRVRTVNSDVMTGGPKADLSQLGAPSGPTLADDPVVKALADCLGNVVAATMVSGKGKRIAGAPTEMATGISSPASPGAAPQMVMCVSWPTQRAAGAYLANVKKVLATGRSITNYPEPYSAMLRHAKVTSVGGATHIVEWQADPANVALLLQITATGDLPALTDCGQWHDLSSAAATALGCG